MVAASFFAAFFLLSCGLAWAQTMETDDAKEEYRRAVLAEKGEYQRGERLFEDAEKTRCKLCHAVEGRGKSLGPDLLGVGSRYDRAGLLESVLDPSAKLHPDYVATTIATKSGKVLTGILRNISEKEVEIATNETERIRLSVDEIEERSPSTTSTMPAGLAEKLSPLEMADLLAYLAGLRSTVEGTLHDARNPREIPRAAEPVRFIPIIGQAQAFRRPVWFGQFPGRPGANVVLEVDQGRVWLLEGESDQPRKTLFVDVGSEITGGEITGLMSLAFHPDFARNRRYFLKMHGPRTDGRLNMIIVERRAADDGLQDSGRPSVLRMKIPVYSEVHNGGDLAFGSDGYLYLGMGDTGPQEDPLGHGQDLGVWWGKILRIDVDRTEGELAYAIPPDNPFRDRPGARPEIWAFGLREPWRISFDRETGDLWVGDVGQNRFEEVAIVRAGENHGWNVFEGFQPHSDRFSSKDSQYVAPVFAYNHAVGPSVTGGHVYRGAKYPALLGKYIFGDFETRRVWALEQYDRKTKSIIELGRAPDRIASFGVDGEGEIYVVGFDRGMIYRLDFEGADLSPALPSKEIVPTSRDVPAEWRFTFDTPEPSWAKPGFDDRSWKIGPGGFGTNGTPGGVVRTVWGTADIWLRREFRLDDTDFKSMRLLVHHDEDAEIYLNGVLAARLPGFIREYDELTVLPEAQATIRAGTNVLAVHCHQTSGGQFIDVGIAASPVRPGSTKSRGH